MMGVKWLFGFVLLIGIQSAICVNDRLQERYNWRVLDFQFPDDNTRQSFLSSNEYIPINNVPLGTEIWRDRFFITVPRWKPGIVSTLNYFRISGASQSPILIPYPSFEMNRIRPNETNYQNKIVSVFRLKVDACDRLWFVDTGIEELAGNTRVPITSRLFVIDLRTDRIIRTFSFPASQLGADTLLGGNMIIDVTADSCNRAFAYIPDSGQYRMIVYSYEENTSWRIRHPYFYVDPFSSPFYIGGYLYLWVDGVLGGALSPAQSDGYRTLYFTSLATNYQFSVNTRYLRDRSVATNNTVLLEAYRFLGTRGSNMQTTSHMLDEKTGVLFYTLVNRNGIGCWNTFRNGNNYSPSTTQVLVTDDETMIFPNDLIIDDSDNLWLLSDRLPVSNADGIRDTNVNFRLFSAPIRDVIRNTVCDTSGSTSNSANSASNSGPIQGNLRINFDGGSTSVGTSTAKSAATTRSKSRRS